MFFQLLCRHGKAREALELCRRRLRDARKNPETTPLALASELAGIVTALLLCEEYAEALPLARECHAIRAEHAPKSWLYYNAMSLLGEALAGVGKHDEAEPLLLEGYERMVAPKNSIMRFKHQALERIVRSYEAQGREDEAAKWRAKLDEGR